MEKKYIIALVVVVVLVGGYVAYRQFKKTGEVSQYEEKTNLMLVAVAQNSATGGMSVMGNALKRYAQDNKRYPQSLLELYPKYVPTKAFIEQIEWQYEPRGDDFTLKKAFVMNNRQMVASVDKSMRPDLEVSTMLASAQPGSGSSAVGVPGARPPAAMGPGAKLPRPGAGPTVAPQERRPGQRPAVPAVEKKSLTVVQGAPAPGALQHRRGPDTGQDVEEPSEEAPMEQARSAREPEESPPPEVPETFTVVSVENCEGPALEESRRQLVWKDRSGILGFGNVDYPADEALTISTAGKWYNVRRPAAETLPPREQETAHSPASQLTGQDSTTDALAARLSERFLVWKDKQGTLGFGNLSYPPSDVVSQIWIDGKWQNI